MPSSCNDINLLQYSGTSQVQRQLQALLAAYAKVDERSVSQLILFAKKYGAYLNYYDAANEIAGDWQDFMAKDVSVTIASIADWRIKDITPFTEYIKDEVQDAPGGDEAKKYFKNIFDLVFTLAKQLDESLRRLPPDVGYVDFLSVAIASNLAIPLTTLNQYYTAFKDAPLSLIDEASDYIDAMMPVDAVVLSGGFSLSSLSNTWQIPSFTAPTITLEGADAKNDISHVLTHNLFTGPLQSFINGIINIVSKTPAYLEETLSNYPSHEPHYALYLAFLRLFRFAQDGLNRFTQNHLDFYYKDVLQLKNRKAEPDFVHLVFELQKNVEQYLLKKDIAFKAGKDANNNDIFYAITYDVVLQKSTVRSMHSLYLDKSVNGALYASPVADSDDGNGAKLTSPDKSWFVFGDAKKILPGSIGFSIASGMFFLNEGNRTVTITFQCDSLSGISVNELEGAFEIRLTGEKDWYTVPAYTVTIAGQSLIFAITLAGDVPPILPYSKKIHGEDFDTTLPIAQLSLLDYSIYQKIKAVKINSLTLNVSATVKNLSLQNADGKIDAAKPFKPFGDFPKSNASFIIGSKEIFQKPITALSVNIDWQPVDTSLLKALVAPAISGLLMSDKLSLNDPSTIQLMNDVIDPGVSMSKNFLQTGNNSAQKKFMINDGADKSFSQTANIAQAEKTSSQDKIFSKDNSIIIAQIVAGASPDPAPADLVALSAGEWTAVVLDSSTNLLTDTLAVPASLAANIPIVNEDFSANEEYAVDDISGFIKLTLKTSDYSLSTYLANTEQALGQTSVSVNYDTSNNITSYTVDPPKLALQPPQLIAGSASITYSATSVIDFNNKTNIKKPVSSFYHNEPFGGREMYPAFTADAITLLPIFNLDNGQAADTGGELWIGLKDAFPGETLSVLFEVSDGSANPLKNMTEVIWYYLSNNNWLPFEALNIVDETNNLTRSGIVTINLPVNITAGNTRADASLIWIKLAADHDTDAVCKLISVRANAAKATFVQDTAKAVEFTEALPPSAISKPAVAIAEVKKTEQPYSSFGGRIKETDNQFYIRVSERLRHKQRAVTTWDYERLILDYFPQIHKAKCINHTGFITSSKTNQQKYSEVAPGHVMVVTVPDLTNTLSANLLRPYTSVGQLEEIQQYLAKFTSPFVRLQVTNPQFEEVQFDFEVSFLPGNDINFYTKLLSDEIEQFLTPWAYESTADIEFGGKIQKSVVLDFVEERPYVDFITCFTMNHIILRNGNIVQQALYNIEEATASSARSVLVSYKDEDDGTRHIIKSPANCNCNG